jgi:ActR/RegA family two-component response regulator
MPPSAEAVESILIVEDEEPVRQTFREWLEGAGFPCHIYTAADAEGALIQANQHPIDLTILDWNLGAGNDGLQLLEDLFVFHPDIVAILVTGFADQATPLDAMRMGVRDYLDKNQDLTRESFLAAVGRQLEQIRPAKRERWLHQSLLAFRETVEKVLPLVQSTAALNDPVPLPHAIRSLFRFLLDTTGARDGVLVVHSYDAERQPPEVYRAYDSTGSLLEGELVPFANSLAGSALSMQGPTAATRLADVEVGGAVRLQPFERGRQTVLAAPISSTPGMQIVLELFDKPEFTEADHRLVAAAAEFGAELLHKAMAEHQTKRTLLSAVGAALGASESLVAALEGTARQRREQAPPAAVMEQIREGLRTSPTAAAGAEESVRLAEAVRVLAVRHGPVAVKHCTRLVEDLRELLDTVTGMGEPRP